MIQPPAGLVPQGVTPGVDPHDKLENAVRQILSNKDIPGCSQHIQALVALTVHPEASASAVTSIILKDVALTLSVLRAANSALYNRSGRPILSVAHAVAMLGLEQVGHIASGVRFLQQFSTKDPGIRELVTLSLLTACQSRRIAYEVDYPRPEEAYLCGLLRNLGEILIAYYFPRQYSEVLVRLQKNPAYEQQV